MFACVHGGGVDLPALAAGFAPEFEITDAQTVVFEIDALHRLYGAPARIAEAIAGRAEAPCNVAIADTVDGSILAARYLSGLQVRPDVSQFAVDCLPLDDAMADVLESWGIRTLEQLAELPESGIAERFGQAGLHLQRLARGTVERPLRIYKPEAEYTDRIELEHPVGLLEPLLFLIARMLNEQCERLLAHGLSTNEVALVLELEDRTEHVRTLRLPIAMRQSKPLLKLLQMDLEGHPPGEATVALRLSLKPVPPRTVQQGIFQPVTPAADRLELTLARIRSLVGEGNAGTPMLLDTHHPHAFRMSRDFPALSKSLAGSPAAAHQVVRYFRPPLPAQLELRNGRPARIRASGIAGVIAIAAGPWRSSGNWWTTDAVWERDEWDIALGNDAVYRIYNEPGGRWFVEGAYD